MLLQAKDWTAVVVISLALGIGANTMVGFGLGFLASRLLASVVYQASSHDPVVLLVAVVVMCAIGLAASWLPARRALMLDPVRTLRED